MDVVAVHQGGDGVLFSLAAQNQALGFREILSLPPLSRLEWNMLISFFQLFARSPAGGTVLAIPDGSGFDAIERTAGVGGEYDSTPYKNVERVIRDNAFQMW